MLNNFKRRAFFISGLKMICHRNPDNNLKSLCICQDNRRFEQKEQYRSLIGEVTNTYYYHGMQREYEVEQGCITEEHKVL
jgi:hypothetical protein